jgi:hypothetical protein
MIAPDNAPRPAELCASASVKGIAVTITSRKRELKIRPINRSSGVYYLTLLSM